MLTARAAIAGALAMLFGVWVMVRIAQDVSPPPAEQVVGGGVILLIIVLLLLGIDPRRQPPKDGD